jgi:hypothetical protein
MRESWFLLTEAISIVYGLALNPRSLSSNFEVRPKHGDYLRVGLPPKDLDKRGAGVILSFTEPRR